MSHTRHWLRAAAAFQPADDIPGTPGDDTLTGTDGADTINGGLGADLMQGGLGDDTYVVDNAADSIAEAAGAGIDTVVSSISYTLGDNVERLQLAGAANLNGNGNAGNNELVGNNGANRLFGGDGRDRLSGGVGNDTLAGGIGNDTLDGGDGYDLAHGNEGNDLLHTGLRYGGELYGDAGNDRLIVDVVGGGYFTFNTWCKLYGGEGNDFLDARGSDTYIDLNGDEGDDTLVGGNAGGYLEAGILNGDDGNDLLIAGTNAGTRLYGRADDDTLRGGDGNDELDGNEGNDQVYAGAGKDGLSDSDDDADTYDGGAGQDNLEVFWHESSDAVHWVFTQETHTVHGNTLSGIESLYASLGMGSDYLDASLASYVDVNGNDGDDVLIGSHAAGDKLDGNAGNDWLQGGGGDDTLYGDAFSLSGDDTVQGGDGNDKLDGDDGSDQVSGDAGDDYVNDGDADADTCDGGDGIDTLAISWTGQADGVHWVFSTGSQTVNGNLISGFEELLAYAGSGDDFVDAAAATSAHLYGYAGNDTLIGTARSDFIGGGAGSDRLTGGKGNDKFEFGSASADADAVLDFTSTKDRVHVMTRQLPIGNGDDIVSGATTIAGPGGFAANAELVIVTANIAGTISADSAAAAIGSADSAYGRNGTALFAVDNGVDSAVYYFKSSGNDAQVSAGELTLLATLVGTASTVVADYEWRSGYTPDQVLTGT